MPEFVNEQVHVLVGTKGDTSLCSLTLPDLVPELIIRERPKATCARCLAIVQAFKKLFGPAEGDGHDPEGIS